MLGHVRKKVLYSTYSMSFSNISKLFTGTGRNNISAAYGYNYENITLNVGMRSDAAPIYAVNVKTDYALNSKGEKVKAPRSTCSSLASGNAKCFLHNMTQIPTMDVFDVWIDFLKMKNNDMYGFLILPNHIRGSGKISFTFREVTRFFI